MKYMSAPDWFGDLLGVTGGWMNLVSMLIRLTPTATSVSIIAQTSQWGAK